LRIEDRPKAESKNKLNLNVIELKVINKKSKILLVYSSE